MTLRSPEPLTDAHDLAAFDCGSASLNTWLARRAMANQGSGATRTYVVCQGRRVIGYFALAAGAIISADSTGRFRRNMPEPIPVVLLARLAVDRTHHGKGIGSALMADAIKRVLASADAIGVRGMVVHAIDEQAWQFYRGLGFEPSPSQPMTLMITVGQLRASL